MLERLSCLSDCVTLKTDREIDRQVEQRLILNSAETAPPVMETDLYLMSY